MDKIEQLLIETVQRDKLNIPFEFTNTIKKALDNERINNKQNHNYFIKIITICATMLLCTGIAFAISNKGRNNTLRNYINTNESQIKISNGIEEAINNGYNQYLDQDYIINNNLGIKIDNIIMDDYNLYLLFNIDYNSNIEDIGYIKIKDINIFDENQNLLYDGNENIINSKKENIVNQLSIRYQKNSNENFYQSLNLASEKFPRCKNIYINIDTVEVFINSKGYKKYKNLEIKGKWNFKIDIDDKMINRETIKYTLKDNEKFKLTSGIIGSTQAMFNLEMVDKDINITSIELRDKNNNSYGIAKYFSLSNGKIKAIFDVTLFEINDDIKLIIKSSNNEDIILDLIK